MSCYLICCRTVFQISRLWKFFFWLLNIILIFKATYFQPYGVLTSHQVSETFPGIKYFPQIGSFGSFANLCNIFYVDERLNCYWIIILHYFILSPWERLKSTKLLNCSFPRYKAFLLVREAHQHCGDGLGVCSRCNTVMILIQIIKATKLVLRINLYKILLYISH